MDGVRDAMKCASSVSKSLNNIYLSDPNSKLVSIKLKLFDFETTDIHIYIFFLFFLKKSHAKEQDQVGHRNTFHRLSGHNYRIQIRQIRQHSG